jgi:nitrate reductase delta subunit
MAQQMTSQTLRIIGLALTYPTSGLLEAAGEMQGLLECEGWLPPALRRDVSALLDDLAGQDLLDAQEAYVDLFDRTPSLSLHLFEHVHGDSRDRGQALVDLDTIYRERGLENRSEHTPDYLPMFLEYLALLPVEEARSMLAGAIEVIGAIGARLKKRQSRYACLFDALEAAAACKPDPARLQSALAADAGEIPDNEALDAAWQEQFALAALDQGEAGCPKVEDMLARMQDKLPEAGVRS